jgi:hypothetical protein
LNNNTFLFHQQTPKGVQIQVNSTIVGSCKLCRMSANFWWGSSFLVQDDDAFFSACIIPLGVFLLELHLGNAILLPFGVL